MTDTKANIFIEGMQGTGKSTLLNKLAGKMPEYTAFREGDISPVELAWCSYMTEDIFQETLKKYPHLKEEILGKTVQENGYCITAYTRILAEDRGFYEYMESHEIYHGRVMFETFRDIIYRRYRAFDTTSNLFECSFFQNSIETMMLFYEMSDEEIVEFYRGAYDILKNKGFKLLYLDSEHIRENLLHIRRERCDNEGNEMWYPLLLSYLMDSPYGMAHNYRDMEDVIAHFEKRRELELRIIGHIMGEDAVVLTAKEYAEEAVFNIIKQW